MSTNVPNLVRNVPDLVKNIESVTPVVAQYTIIGVLTNKYVIASIVVAILAYVAYCYYMKKKQVTFGENKEHEEHEEEKQYDMQEEKHEEKNEEKHENPEKHS